jgi:hypothetical protein
LQVKISSFRMEHCYSIFGFKSKKIRFFPLAFLILLLELFCASIHEGDSIYKALFLLLFTKVWSSLNLPLELRFFCNLLFWDRSLCHKSIVMNNYMNLGVTALLALINKIRKINSNKYNNVRIFFLCLAVNKYAFDDISSREKA